MAQQFNYNGGREGSHSVILCKPVGGGVIDIENVPIDQANSWITDKGYYQCDGTGDPAQVGYCIPHPAGDGQAAGYDCTPAPAQQLGTVSFAGEPSPIAPHGTLPDVGSSSIELFVGLAVAVIVGLVVAKWPAAGRVLGQISLFLIGIAVVAYLAFLALVGLFMLYVRTQI